MRQRFRDIGGYVEKACGRVREHYLPLLAADASVVEFAHASCAEDALSVIRPWAEAGHISRLAQSTSVDRLGIPNYYATRPASLHKDTIIAGGKGVTDRAAILSALFEAFERWAAECLTAPQLLACKNDLQVAMPAVPLAAPRCLPGNVPIPWVAGIDLLSLEPCLLPLQRTIFPMPPGTPWVAGLGCDTTGLASGTNATEAICSGLLELIERDVTSQMTLQTAMAIDASTLPSVAADLVKRFDQAGVEVRVSRLESPTGVPVFHAFSRDDHLRLSQFFCSGAGAHPQREVALTRALTEVAQSRSGYITTIRDDVSAMAESLTAVPYEVRRAELARWFQPERTIAFDVIPTEAPHPTFQTMLRNLLNRIALGVSDAIVAWVPLHFERALHACRVYCPQLRNPSIDLA